MSDLIGVDEPIMGRGRVYHGWRHEADLPMIARTYAPGWLGETWFLLTLVYKRLDNKVNC